MGLTLRHFKVTCPVYIELEGKVLAGCGGGGVERCQCPCGWGLGVGSCI